MIYIGGLFASVWLPEIYTFNQLSPTDVPFYISNSRPSTERWRAEYWITFTDIFRIIPIFVSMSAFAGIIIMKDARGWIYFYAISIYIVLIIEVVKLAYRGAIWAFFCGENNLCRSWDSLVGNPSDANWIWYVNVIGNGGVVIFLLLYSVIGFFLQSSAFEYIYPPTDKKI